MGEITFIVLWLYYRIVLVYSHKNVFKNSRTRLEYVAILEVAEFFQKPLFNQVQLGLSRYSIN